jgi:hypothetical protein
MDDEFDGLFRSSGSTVQSVLPFILQSSPAQPLEQKILRVSRYSHNIPLRGESLTILAVLDLLLVDDRGQSSYLLWV